jgi:hypothetical protein
VYLWMPVVVWGVMRVIRALIDWRAKVDYEQARAASVAAVVSAIPAGATIWDRRVDGTELRVDIPARQEQRDHGPLETAGTESC